VAGENILEEEKEESEKAEEKKPEQKPGRKPKAHKIAELDGKKIKVEVTGLKGKIVILDPEKSEVAKSLEIKEKGVYSVKTL